MIKYNYNMN